MNKLDINLKNLLLNANISESELARKTGIAQQIINRILSGKNKNPKLSTLIPIANYFMLSISQLIGDDISEHKVKLNTNHLGWQEIPIIDWNLLTNNPLHELLLLSQQKILVDVEASTNIFALKMCDNSMEPKFTKETILIINPNKKPIHGDFSLLIDIDNKMALRQIFIKKNKYIIKNLNKKYISNQINLLQSDINSIGVLIKSITNHANI